jgi:hypothetical protein
MVRMELIEVVFVTVPSEILDHLSVEEDILLDDGTTDRQGHGFLFLLYGQKARVFLDDLLEAGILLDYTLFTLPVSALRNLL